MSIQKINFTSTAFDNKRFSLQTKPVVTAQEKQVADNNPAPQEENNVKTEEEKAVSQENAPESNAESDENNEYVPVSNGESHKARNWTIGLSAAAVLTGLGVLAGRHGYMGDGVQRMLKGAKREAGELIDDVSESVTGSINRTAEKNPIKPAEESTGSVLGRAADESETAGSVLGSSEHESGFTLPKQPEPAAESESLVIGNSAAEEAEEETVTLSSGLRIPKRQAEGEGSSLVSHAAEDEKAVHVSTSAEEDAAPIIGRAADESEETGSVIGRVADDEEGALSRATEDLAEEEVGAGLPRLDDEVEEAEAVLAEKIFSKDGKFQIPRTKEEIDMKATRKYLKSKKVKLPKKKYRTLPELKIEEILSDFKPENVDKSKITGSVYVHQLPKGEKLKVYYDWTNSYIRYVERYNAKEQEIGYVGYFSNGKIMFVEHPNGIKFKYNSDGDLIYGERTVGSDTYHYNSIGALERIDQKISDTVERKIFLNENGKINKVNHYVDTSEGKKLIKEDIYFYTRNKIREYFDVNGDNNTYVHGKDTTISQLEKLKFWKSPGFKSFLDDITSEAE